MGAKMELDRMILVLYSSNKTKDYLYTMHQNKNILYRKRKNKLKIFKFIKELKNLSLAVGLL